MVIWAHLLLQGRARDLGPIRVFHSPPPHQLRLNAFMTQVSDIVTSVNLGTFAAAGGKDQNLSTVRAESLDLGEHHAEKAGLMEEHRGKQG